MVFCVHIIYEFNTCLWNVKQVVVNADVCLQCWNGQNRVMISLKSVPECIILSCFSNSSTSCLSSFALHTLEHSDTRFELIRRFVLGESIRFVKKSAIRFGRCIRLINDHTPWHSPILHRCISHSAVQLILLTLCNIYWLNWVQIRKIYWFFTADVFVKLWEWLMMTEESWHLTT